MLGSNMVIAGKTAMATKTSRMGRISGSVALITRVTGISAIDAVTNKQKPTGGVINPINNERMTSIPNCKGDSPTSIEICEKTGTKTSMAKKRLGKMSWRPRQKEP